MDTKTEEMLEAIRKLVAEGKHVEAEDFLFAHFEELPEGLQGDLLIEFIKEDAAPHMLQHMATDVTKAAITTLDWAEEIEKDIAKIPEKASEH